MDRIEETQTYLNMLQGKLINEKKNYFSTSRNSKNTYELSIYLFYSMGHDTT